MSLISEHTHVFVVRIWFEEREIEDAPPEWRGVIEHMSTQEKVYFRSLQKMIEFVVEKSGISQDAS